MNSTSKLLNTTIKKISASLLFLLLYSVPTNAQMISEASLKANLININRQITNIKTFVSRDNTTGNLRSITRQGLYKGCGVPVGTDSIFYGNGKLNTTHTYKHFSPEQNRSCHKLITHRKTLQYYKTGQIKTKQEYSYCYECEPKPVGVWESYSPSGRLLHKEKYGNTP